MADLELLSIGLINDMYVESENDECNYVTLIAFNGKNQLLMV